MSERLSHSEGSRPVRRREQVNQQVAEGFQNLVAELRQGRSERFQRYLDFCARFHGYSSHNQMLVFSQRPDATFVAGYQHWRELGHQVKRREKGIEILAPVTYKRKDDEEKEDRLLAGFKVVHVFDASQLVQTKEKPIPSFWQRLPDDREAVYGLVKGAVEGCGIEVREARLRGGTQGFSRGGKTTLARDRDSRSRTMTLVHEWAHEIMHQQGGESERQNLPMQVLECQAEAVSYIVSHYLGIENSFARDYLLSYGNTAEELIGNLDQVQKASHFMIELLQPKNNVAQYDRPSDV